MATSTATSLDVVQRLFETMAQGPDGAQATAALLSEDMTFNGPILKANSRDEFFAGMAEFNASMAEVEGGPGEMKMRHLFEDGPTVCAVYDFVLPTGSVTNVQLFTVTDGLITAQELIFDRVEFQTVTGP